MCASATSTVTETATGSASCSGPPGLGTGTYQYLRCPTLPPQCYMDCGVVVCSGLSPDAFVEACNA